ncbi:BrnT family toxin [Bifidobacterium boum]
MRAKLPSADDSIDGKHWTAITTRRGNRIRLISVRRSRKDEERYYDHCE